MKCEEYRRLFARAIQGELPEHRRVREYQEHFVACQKCQLLLNTDGVIEAAARLASLTPQAPDQAEFAAEMIRGVKRKASRHHLVSQTGASLILTLVCLLTLVAPTPSHRVVPLAPVATEPWAFASGLDFPGFELKTAYEVARTGKVFLQYERKDPRFDVYAFSKELLLEIGRSPRLPPVVITSISDDKGCVLQFLAARPQVQLAVESGSELAPVFFLRLLNILYDREGHTAQGGME
jgi:hypothetical protein